MTCDMGAEAPECLGAVTTIGCFTDIGGCEETSVTRGRGSHDTGTRATSDIVGVGMSDT